MNYKIIPIEELKPLEQVFPTHFKNLEDKINEDGFMLKAIIADEKTGTVLDGSHRYIYMLKNGYKEAPVHLVDYNGEDIRVGTRLGHRFLIDRDPGISKALCIENAMSGNLFSPRTTRHFFPFRKLDISLPLSLLNKGEPVDVSRFIADVDISEEIEHNKKYIDEIKEETEIIIQYLSEVSETKKYLEWQVKAMDSSRQVAFFPGKFHPPHIGHILTILSIMPKYRKVIIGVSEHLPDEPITTPDDIIKMLTDFFSSFDNVEVCKIEGILGERKNLDGLPSFDVLLSGNEKILNWAKSMGVNATFTSRSSGELCSGTEIRKTLKV